MQKMQDFDRLCADTVKNEMVPVRRPTRASVCVTGREREALREFGGPFAPFAQSDHESHGRNRIFLGDVIADALKVGRALQSAAVSGQSG